MLECPGEPGPLLQFLAAQYDETRQRAHQDVVLPVLELAIPAQQQGAGIRSLDALHDVIDARRHEHEVTGYQALRVVADRDPAMTAPDEVKHGACLAGVGQLPRRVQEIAEIHAARGTQPPEDVGQYFHGVRNSTEVDD